MEVIHSIFVPLFDCHYSTEISTVKVRVLILCEQTWHILLILFFPAQPSHAASASTVLKYRGQFARMNASIVGMS